MTLEGFVIEQPAGQRTLALREAYLGICDADACEAHLLNALERWYAYKLKVRDESRGRNRAAAQGGESPSADESLWVRMSAAQWAEKELMGLYNEKTVRAKLTRLVERGFVMTRSHPKLGWDRTPQWLFNREAVQGAVDAWAGTRGALDLDPSDADALGQPSTLHSDKVPNAPGRNVRVHSDKVPNGPGQSSESTRTNVRSNNTDILSQESFSGGEYNVSETARATQHPAGRAGDARNVPFTTTGAALEKQGGHETAEADNVAAMLPPDGGAADAAAQRPVKASRRTRLDLGGADAHATSSEGVPRAARGIPGDSPAADSESHDPAQTRQVLEAALGGAKKLAALLKETPPGLGGSDRARWLSAITPARAQRLIAEARLNTALHPWTALTQLLDAEIGARLMRGSAPTAAGPAATSPRSHAPAARLEPQDTAEDQGKYQPGAVWCQLSTGRELRLVSVETKANKQAGQGAHYLFDDGSKLGVLELMRGGYEFRRRE